MVILGFLVLLFLLASVVTEAAATGDEKSNEKSAPATPPPPALLTSVTTPVRTGPPSETASAVPSGGVEPVVWSNSDWRALDLAVGKLPFRSSWSFDRCVRRSDRVDGDDEAIWTIDLHGLSGALAGNAVALFLKDLRVSHNTRCRIISGRGNNSAGAAVLPRVVANELGKQRAREQVAAYSDEYGYFDVRLPRRTAPAADSGRWPCGHRRGPGETRCWDCVLF